MQDTACHNHNAVTFAECIHDSKVINPADCTVALRVKTQRCFRKHKTRVFSDTLLCFDLQGHRTVAFPVALLYMKARGIDVIMFCVATVNIVVRPPEIWTCYASSRSIKCPQAEMRSSFPHTVL